MLPHEDAAPTTAMPAVDSGAREAIAPWRRALGLLWVGQVVSHVGDSLFLAGIFYLALDVTGSKAAAGLVMAMGFVPALGLGLFAGAFVDRHDRRHMMVGADLLRAIAVGAIPLLYLSRNLGPVGLGAAIFALATGSTLFNPALKALIPEITPRGHLTAAVALFQISEFAALVVGPLLALLLIPRLGSIHLFTVDALTFLFSATCVFALPAAARRVAHAAALRPRDGRTPWRGAPTSVLSEVVTGVRAVFATPVLRPLVVLVALDNLLLAGLYQVASPLLVKEKLGLGTPAWASVQMFFSMGMVAASAGFWLLARRAHKGLIILVGVALDGLTYIPLAFCHSLGQVQAALFLHALAVPMIIIPRTVLVQQLVPGPLHGRAFALMNVTVFGMTALSIGLTGFLAEHLSSQTLFLLLGAAGALPGLCGIAFRRLRSA
jgi:MFS family permease